MAGEEFFPHMTAKKGDSDTLKECVAECVRNLLQHHTQIEKPGMLLGKIQSGKTRAFIRVIALAFDNDYDMAIVLTKGTKALAQQTYMRLKEDFSDFCDDDIVEVCDIMHLPKNYVGYELKKKLIIIVKKETNNLRRIHKALVETYPDLSRKKLLIIDDEADYASIGFKVNRSEGVVEINKIARQINDLRQKVSSYDFLQVTATPYSLYLQPEEYQEGLVKPIRPAFTVLLPDHPGYIGGEYYFEESKDEHSPAHFMFEEVPSEELDLLRVSKRLKRADRRSFKLEDALFSPRIRVLRRAIVNFIVGACVRRVQHQQQGKKPKKYSFIVHTEQSRASHTWQEMVVTKIKDLLRKTQKEKPQLVERLTAEGYADISESVRALGVEVPSYEKIQKEVSWILSEDCLMITKVNSEKDAQELLNEKGQLRLRAPLNIFIGGQILDRGLTIDNLTGFYYGRKPRKFQQDTVLQHSRMYGNRSREDLAVSRFYTAHEIYDAMERIHELDTALREAFEREAQEAGVVFIRSDTSNRVMPYSPNKILLSTTTTLTRYKRLLPFGFQTGYRTKIAPILKALDRFIDKLTPHDQPHDHFLIDLTDALWILDKIHSMFTFEDGIDWDVSAYKASVEFLSKNTADNQLRGKVMCLVRTGRNNSRMREGGRRFFNAPDTAHVEGKIARENAIEIPMLMLFRQNGREDHGWRGSPFWWPVLLVPRNAKTVIFASNLVDSN